MATKQYKDICALCGQPVKIKGFTLKTTNGEIQNFCCGGCLSIFQLLNETSNYITIIDPPNNNEDIQQ